MDKTPDCLTPNQAADVLRWSFAGENKEFTDRGWKPKICMGKVATHATTSNRNHFVPGMDSPLLSHREMVDGLDLVASSGSPHTKTLTNEQHSYAISRDTPAIKTAQEEDREPDWAERASGDDRWHS